MKAQIVNEGTMEDSYIFSLFNENKELTSKMLAYIKSSVSIDEDELQEQLLQIRKSRISPLVEEVLGAFARGEIEILYSRTVKVPIATPFIVRRDPSFQGNGYGIRSTIFIANYGTVTKATGAFDIPMKNLYVLLESAYIALYIHTRPTQIQRNIALMKILCSVYTSLFTRILNKEYSLSLDQDLYDRVNFIISKFFLEKVWEATNKDVIFNTAMINILNPNFTDLKMINEQYESNDIKDISDALIMIRDLSPRMSNLSVKYIIQRFMTTYNGGGVIAIDYLPYMFFMIINTLLGGFILNQTSLADIVKNQKMIKLFYPELTKIIL